MGRQQMPKMDETPVFGSQREAEESGAPVAAVQEGSPPPAFARPLPVPVAGYTPPQHVLRQLEETRKRLADLEEQATRPLVIPVPKKYRVLGLPVGGMNFMGKNGQMSRLRPEKLLDERYFPIEYMRQQGFQLVEVGGEARQLGTV